VKIYIIFLPRFLIGRALIGYDVSCRLYNACFVAKWHVVGDRL